MKLFSVFMVILVAGVSVQCVNVHPALEQNQIQNQRYFDLISGIASVIGQLIQQTHQAIENFRTQILQNINDRLQAFEVYLVDSANAFQNYVQNVQAQIDVLINGRIKPCLSDIPDNIKAANLKTRQDINECVKNGKAQLALVGDGVEQYRIGTRQEIEKSQKKIDECVKEPNFGNKIICAIEASRVVSSAVSRIRDNIVNTIAIYRANIGAIVSGTNQCIHTRIQQGQEQVAGILEQARQCLEGSEETTTPIDDGSETTTPIDDDSATTIRNL